jgi:phenylacetate-CoA ligase
MVPPLHPPIVRNIIYPVYRGLRGDLLLPLLERFERNQWLAPAELEDLQWPMLHDLLVTSATYVHYYKELFERSDIDPRGISNWDEFRKIPLLTNNEIREAGKSMLTTDPTRKGFPVRASDGGGGIYLYGDAASGVARRANTLRCYRWAGVDVGDRQAILLENRPEMKPGERMMQGLKNYFNNILLLEMQDVSRDSLRENARKLERFAPAVLVGSPSMLEGLGRFSAEEGIDGIRPTALITSGELLSLERRETIERFFRCPVYDRYKRMEFDIIAHECPEHGGFHIFSDLVYVEVLDSENEPVSSGEVGELVITDLGNHYMPLVRYKTGDLATRSDRTCPCGRGLPLLERIESRSLERGDKEAPSRHSPPHQVDTKEEERLVVKSKIHKARITGERPEEMDCLVVDARLLELSDISDGEKVLIVDNTNGARVETFAVEGPGRSGEIVACGAASKQIHSGDEVSIMAFAWAGGSSKRFSNILVDENNRFVRYLTEIAGEML